MKSKTSNPHKKYIVTYNAPNTTLAEAQDILNLPGIKDGISIMATDYVANDTDVLHLEAIGASIVNLTSDEAAHLQNDARVMAVEEDIEVHILNISEQHSVQNLVAPGNNIAQGLGAPVGILSSIPWNINLVKAPAAWARGINGTGVNVAVIDTGIATHTDLIVAGGACFVPGTTSYTDNNGHGTHCAGVIAAQNNANVAGVAPGAALYAVKVLDAGGSGQLSWILAGMAWALQNNIHVVSMSLGSSTGPIVAYTNAITQLINAGITVCCAVGNAYGTAFPWVGAPANSHVSAIAIGAVDAGNVIAYFSSRDVNGIGWNPVTLVAPGVNVDSTYPFPPNSYHVMSGTSMATPHVAGAAALVKQKYPAFTPLQVISQLTGTCTHLGVAGINPTYGAGLIDCDKATL